MRGKLKIDLSTIPHKKSPNLDVLLGEIYFVIPSLTFRKVSGRKMNFNNVGRQIWGFL